MMIFTNDMIIYLQNKLIAWIQNGPSDDSRRSNSAKAKADHFEAVRASNDPTLIFE